MGILSAIVAFISFLVAFAYYPTEVKEETPPIYVAFCVSFLVGCVFLALCIVIFLKLILVGEFPDYKTYPCFAGKASADDIQKGVYAVVRKEDGTASKSASCVCQDSCIDPVSKAGVPWKFGEKCPAAGGKSENEVNQNPRCKHN
jgi:hypothetical protein